MLRRYSRETSMGPSLAPEGTERTTCFVSSVPSVSLRGLFFVPLWTDLGPTPRASPGATTLRRKWVPCAAPLT